MQLFRSLGVAGWAYRNAFTKMAKPSLWLPFLVMAAMQLLGLLFYLNFHRGGLASLGVPLVTWLGGAPKVFLVLGLADLAFALVHGALLWRAGGSSSQPEQNKGS